MAMSIWWVEKWTVDIKKKKSRSCCWVFDPPLNHIPTKGLTRYIWHPLLDSTIHCTSLSHAAMLANLKQRTLFDVCWCTYGCCMCCCDILCKWHVYDHIILSRSGITILVFILFQFGGHKGRARGIPDQQPWAGTRAGDTAGTAGKQKPRPDSKQF